MLIETLEFDDDIFAAGRYKSFSLYFCCEIDNDTSYKVNKCFLDSENGLCLEKQIKRENQIKHLKEINVKLILCYLLYCFLLMKELFAHFTDFPICSTKCVFGPDSRELLRRPAVRDLLALLSVCLQTA